MARVFTVAVASVCCIVLSDPARTDTPTAALDNALEQIVTRFRITGLAVGVIQDGSPIYARGFGVRDSRTGKPVTPHTQFHAASLTKTLTATAILQLAEQGKLAINDPVERFLPAFAGSGITIAQLLTHSAGLLDWSRPTGTSDDAAVARYVTEVARHERAYQPGRGWEYSDTDFNILGAVIEAASGVSYPDYMQRFVLERAGMAESTFHRLDESGDVAWPHPGEPFVRRASDYPWDRVFLPSSGLQTSVTDLMRWAAVNLDRRPELLSASSYEALFTRRLDTAWPGVAMGLGWQLEQRGDRWLPRHPGGDPGFRAVLTLYPDAHRAIVILSNSETTPRWEIRQVIEAALDGKPIVLPEPPALARYRWLIVLAAIALVVAGALALWRRRSRRAKPRGEIIT